MKKIISLMLALVLMFSLAVPSFATAEPNATSDDVLTKLVSGWGSPSSSPSFPSGYGSSWFYRIASNLYSIYDYTIDINSAVTLIKTHASYISTDIDLIKLDVDNIYSNILLIKNSLNTVNNNLSNIDDSVDGLEGLLTTSNSSLSSIDSDTSSILSDTSSIDDKTSTIISYLRNTVGEFYKNFDALDLESPFDSTSSFFDSVGSNIFDISKDIDYLQKVLADEDDLAFKESQKDNQELIQDTFFSPGNDLSLDTSKITEFTEQFTDFTEAFDFSENIPSGSSPLDSISDGSDFSQWFTNETGLDMDPTFGGGSGGGGETPDPDEPDPDEPDPDEPDPPTPTIKNWLPLATTEPGGTEIFNSVGWQQGVRWSSSSNIVQVSTDFNFLTGWIPVSSGSVVYTHGLNFSINDTVSNIYFVQYSDGSYSSLNILGYESDSNGVSSFSVSDNVVSVRFGFFGFLNGSENAVISVDQYPIQTASTFSLRSSSSEPEIVTTAYSDRIAEYKKLLGGDN